MGSDTTYRFKYAASVKPFALAWALLFVLKIVNAFQLNPEIPFLGAVETVWASGLTSLVFLVGLIPPIVIVAYPVKLRARGLTACNRLGLWVTIPFEDLVGPEEKYVWGMKNYMFRSRRNPRKRLYVASHVKGIDACLAEIQARMNPDAQ